MLSLYSLSQSINSWLVYMRWDRHIVIGGDKSVPLVSAAGVGATSTLSNASAKMGVMILLPLNALCRAVTCAISHRYAAGAARASRRAAAPHHCDSHQLFPVSLILVEPSGVVFDALPEITLRAARFSNG